MIGGVHHLRVRVGRAEVAQALERVASQMALQQITIVIGDGVQMMIGGVLLAVNQARADQDQANRVRVVDLRQMMTMLGAGVKTTIGEALLVENLGRVVVARVNLERVARQEMDQLGMEDGVSGMELLWTDLYAYLVLTFLYPLITLQIIGSPGWWGSDSSSSSGKSGKSGSGSGKSGKSGSSSNDYWGK